MKRPYKIAIILLLIALAFSITTFVIANYFPELRSSNNWSSNDDEGGNLKIVVEPPEVSAPPAG